MAADNVTIVCECNLSTCKKRITLPAAEVDRFKQQGMVIILDGCKPEASDMLVETGNGYRLFRES